MTGPLINPPSVGSPLLSRQRISVEVDGHNLVAFTAGNSTLTMDYETALQVSQWLRVRAKEAKRKAGDTSRKWSIVGVFEGLKS